MPAYAILGIILGIPLLLGMLLTIAVWYFTKSNSTAIWLTLVIDVAATSMIILKLRSQPHSEDPQPWIVATVAYVFTCLALVGKPMGILYVRPLYGLIGDAILVFCIYHYKRKSNNVTHKLSTAEF